MRSPGLKEFFLLLILTVLSFSALGSTVGTVPFGFLNKARKLVFRSVGGYAAHGLKSWQTGESMTLGSEDRMLGRPYGVATDISNNLYIADLSNNRIVKLSPTGAFVGAIGRATSSTGTCPASNAAASWCTGGVFASGSGDGMYSSPIGVAVDGSGNLYVVDHANHRIVKVSSTGAFVGAVGRAASSTGTCPASGAASTRCTGGVFTSGSGDGM